MGSADRSQAKDILFGGMTIAILWETIPRLFGIDSAILPPFSAVLNSIFQLHGVLMPHVIETLEETLLGFTLSVVSAWMLAIPIYRYLLARRLLLYPLLAIQNVPKVALAPLLVLWLSHGILPKVAMAALVSFFPIFQGILEGLERDKTGLRSTLAVLSPSSTGMLIKVLIPEAMPGFLVGCRIGITFAIIGAIVGEMAQPSSGLGYLIRESQDSFQGGLEFAAVFLVSVVGIALYVGVVIIERAFFLQYRRPVSANITQEVAVESTTGEG